MAEEKANMMRILDQKRVPYAPHHYAHPNGAVNGADVVALLDWDLTSVCKVLVAQRASRQHCVFVIPVLRLLDLKAVARTVGEKSIETIPQTRLLPLTGYIHGNCSPVGIKEPFPTVLDRGVEGLDAIVVSTEKVGAQAELVPATLCAPVGRTFAPVPK